MRFPKIHSFLKWAGPSLVVAFAGFVGLVIAASSEWKGVKQWAEDWYFELERIVTLPWFMGLAVLLICGYIWALVYTGGEPKREPAASDEPEDCDDGGLLPAIKAGQDQAATKALEVSNRLDREVMENQSAVKPADLSSVGKAILDNYEGEAATYPYRKAVLQVSEIKATATRRAGEESLNKIGVHMDLENKTTQPFKECRVRLVSINGDAVDGESFLRIGALNGEDTKTVFTTYHHSVHRINFMKRDLEDVVSNPPFLLCLDGRDLPLSDSREYQFIFALECEYEHPTYATVCCLILEREKIEISLKDQSLDLPDEKS